MMYSSRVGSNLNTLIKFTFRKLSKELNNNFVILKFTYVRKMASQDRTQDLWHYRGICIFENKLLEKMQISYMTLLLDACGFRKLLSSNIIKDLLKKLRILQLKQGKNHRECRSKAILPSLSLLYEAGLASKFLIQNLTPTLIVRKLAKKYIITIKLHKTVLKHWFRNTQFYLRK